MKTIFVAILVALSLLCFAEMARAQNASSGINTSPMRTTAAAPVYDQGQQSRLISCNNRYVKQHIPENEHAAFIDKCMQQVPANTTPMTPLELAAQKQKSRNCKLDAKAQGLTGNARAGFMQDCLNK